MAEGRTNKNAGNEFVCLAFPAASCVLPSSLSNASLLFPQGKREEETLERETPLETFVNLQSFTNELSSGVRRKGSGQQPKATVGPDPIPSPLSPRG